MSWLWFLLQCVKLTPAVQARPQLGNYRATLSFEPRQIVWGWKPRWAIPRWSLSDWGRLPWVVKFALLLASHFLHTW